MPVNQGLGFSHPSELFWSYSWTFRKDQERTVNGVGKIHYNYKFEWTKTTRRNAAMTRVVKVAGRAGLQQHSLLTLRVAFMQGVNVSMRLLLSRKAVL